MLRLPEITAEYEAKIRKRALEANRPKRQLIYQKTDDVSAEGGMNGDEGVEATTMKMMQSGAMGTDAGFALTVRLLSYLQAKLEEITDGRAPTEKDKASQRRIRARRPYIARRATRYIIYIILDSNALVNERPPSANKSTRGVLERDYG
jgi:hypothetical protein